MNSAIEPVDGYLFFAVISRPWIKFAERIHLHTGTSFIEMECYSLSLYAFYLCSVNVREAGGHTISATLSSAIQSDIKYRKKKSPVWKYACRFAQRPIV